MLSKKIRSYEEKIFEYLIEAKLRIGKGERISVVARDYTNILRENSHLNSLYGYFEKENFGFLKLLEEDIRKKFIMFLFKTENDLLSNFELITKKYPLKRIRDHIVTWIELDKKSFINFRKITPKIDIYDRFHILGCLLLTFFEDRGAKLVTIDKNILECTNEVLNFYSNKQKSLNAKARKVLTLIGN